MEVGCVEQIALDTGGFRTESNVMQRQTAVSDDLRNAPFSREYRVPPTLHYVMRERAGKPLPPFLLGRAFFLLAPPFPSTPLPAEPGLGIGPVLLGGRQGDAEDFRRFRHGAAEKVPQFDQLRLAG